MKKRMPQTEIANCATCGKQPGRSFAHGENGRMITNFYHCFDCGSFGDPAATKHKAVAAWNSKQKGRKE
jgi:hypothetical protein